MTTHSTSLSPQYRNETLNAVDSGAFDVVIIGGGITGMGCALDAASRGLSVALFEQRDIASGTSSRSSKLIHGGLRYLEQFHFGLVREALHERGLLRQTLAPHLVWPIPFVYPIEHRVWERVYMTAGIALYDGLAKLGRSKLPYQWHLSNKELQRVFPGIKKDAFVGGIRYYDAGTDDARYVLAVARTAAGEGARILSSARVTGFLRDGDQVTGVTATCLETGRQIETRAKVVINATGVWTDSVERFAGDTHTDVTASKGIHIVIPRDRIDSSVGFITKTKTSVLFLIPQGDFWIIGTTDTPWDLDLAHPAASRTDIDYVLKQVNKVVETPITHDDIVGVFAGLRPLVMGSAESTAQLSREHSITEPEPGLITIAGGKFTTYRVMAEDTVDRACEAVGIDAPPTTTDQIPLVGAVGFRSLRRNKEALAARYGLPHTQIDRLLHRYGGEIERVLGQAGDDSALLETLPSGSYLAAEVLFAVEHEGALHLDDVLTRRTRLSIECDDRGIDAAPLVARIMAGVLGWDAETVDLELDHYAARVAAEKESQTMPDDLTADAARLGAADVRTLGA
jgi:glycerol-3-phosphate dehydrogenase